MKTNNRDLKIELPYDPAIPFLAIYSKEMKTYIHPKTGMPVFTAAPFKIT